jgi:hypothetical protein
MKYLMLIYSDEKAYESMDPQKVGEMFGAYMAFNEETQKSGQFISGHALQPTSTATTVSVRDGKRMVTDGPFAETKEQLGGYYLLECASLDEAMSLAEKIPDVHTGRVEIRPVVEMPQG